ncbi:MAG: HAD-IIIA family hydrolase [Desulfovibrionaceae bacterium]
MIRQAVILAGGKGTRLGGLTAQTPKPVLPVGGEPFINHLLWNLGRHGITDVIVSTGFQHDVLLAELERRPVPGVRLRFVREEEPLGTGGGLRNCLPLLDERFFVLNGDSIFDMNYLDLALRAGSGRGVAAMGLRRVDDTTRYGRVEVRGELVSSFREKGESGPGFINSGIYCLTSDIVRELPPGASSLEAELFPRLAGEGRLAAGVYDGFFIDIGIPEDFERAQTAVPEWRRKPVLFLDRDGVLNVNHGYVHTRARWTWCRGAREAVKLANDSGALVILVTNQAGIGRGYYPPETFFALMDWVRGELAAVGAHLDAVYHCPHHPEEGLGEYRQRCSCRKPEPGMLLRAVADWNPDMRRSLMIGDSPKDMEAARRAGVAASALFDPETMDLEQCLREHGEALGLAGDGPPR